MRNTILVLLGLLILLTAGCNNGISDCDAVKKAKEQLPTKYADADPWVFLDNTTGINGTWRVTFMNIDVSFKELGWTGDINQYYKYSEAHRELPEGVYANVTIYIDAKTGEMTGRQIDNGVYTGGLNMYANCP